MTSSSRPRRRAALAAFAATAALGAVGLSAPAQAATPAAACTWQVARLALPTGFTAGHTGKSDGATRIAGYGVDSAGVQRPLLWTGSKVRPLPSPGGQPAVAVDVNQLGVVVANIQGSDAGIYAPYLEWNGVTIKLTLPAKATYGYVTAINNAGTIVGYAGWEGHAHAVSWTVASPGKPKDLGFYDENALLVDLTEDGRAVGWTETGENTTVRTLSGEATGPLTSLPGTDGGRAMAADGQYTVGFASLIGAPPGGSVIWSKTGAQALPPLFDSYGVNTKGVVVGQLYDPTYSGSAVWQGGRLTKLPPLPDASQQTNTATDVTEANVVVGTSGLIDGSTVPVTWTCR